MLEELSAKVFHAYPMNVTHLPFNLRKSSFQNFDAEIVHFYPVGEMLKKIREATGEFPRAALYELRDLGYESLFEQACACIISVRTLDEVSLPASLKLFNQAPSPYDVNRLDEEEIFELIKPASFAREKAKALKSIAKITVEKFDGELPADYETLTNLPGLGPKLANLVLGIGGKIPTLEADLHVHRITNRWGYLNTETSEQTLLTLARRLPKKHWTELNEILVPFGKHICQGKKPKCSICPVFQHCERNGVKSSL